jgi:2-polyprenyl-3-methyl-5-hydroxy-6-metoxy-1,4-benzoquinol methylase
MSYTEFSTVYDDLMQDVPYERWADYIMKKIGPMKSVIEAACGTGNVTELLAKNDYKVTAFDLSEEMLVKAYEKVGRKTHVELLKSNMTDFAVDKTFDVAICCCDGLNYLLTEKEAKDFFRKTWEHLNDEGTLIFDFSTRYKFEKELQDKTIVSEEGSVFMVWENSFDVNSKLYQMNLTFFVEEENGLYKRIDEQQTQRPYTINEVVSLLEYVGFNRIEAFDDYSDRQAGPKTQRATFVCRKEK